MANPIKEWRYLFATQEGARRFLHAAQHVVRAPVRLWRERVVIVRVSSGEAEMHDGAFFIWSRDLEGERIYNGPIADVPEERP